MAKLQQRNGAYVIDNVKDLIRAFDDDARLQPYHIPAPWIVHLKTKYQNLPGTRNLGYTVIKPVVLVKPKERVYSDDPKKRMPGFELLIVCKEGNINRDEAIGREYIPNEAEIKKVAAEIRAKHQEMGVVRNAEFVGFALQKVVNRPKISLA